MPTPRHLLASVALLLVFGCVAPAANPNTIFDISKVTVQPQVTSPARPQYPLVLRVRMISGETLIHLVVRRDGSVTDVRVVRATDPLFGIAAAKAVAQWVYRPALLDGRPVNCALEVPIVFTVRNVSQ
jgi:TonB family protein